LPIAVLINSLHIIARRCESMRIRFVKG